MKRNYASPVLLSLYSVGCQLRLDYVRMTDVADDFFFFIKIKIRERKGKPPRHNAPAPTKIKESPAACHHTLHPLRGMHGTRHGGKRVEARRTQALLNSFIENGAIRRNTFR